jgi:hypothetical protein
MKPEILTGRLVELRRFALVGPVSPPLVALWEILRLTDMKPIGNGAISRVEKRIFEVSAGIYRLAALAQGGYGSEPYRLLAQFAVDELGATTVRARARGTKRKAIVEDAGFRVVAWPPHSRPNSPYGAWQLEWELNRN